MTFQPKILGEYEGDDIRAAEAACQHQQADAKAPPGADEIVLFRDDEHGYCIRHDNKIYVLPYWCLGKDTSIYCARQVIKRAFEKPTNAGHLHFCPIQVFSTEKQYL
jgi:hypothetical protein